jgi:hypothetical protein
MKNVFRGIAIVCIVIAIVFPVSGFSWRDEGNGLMQTSHQITTDSVYVCLSTAAYAYHSDYNCRGLKQCEHLIQYVHIEKAQAMRRRPCGYCY